MSGRFNEVLVLADHPAAPFLLMTAPVALLLLILVGLTVRQRVRARQGERKRR